MLSISTAIASNIAALDAGRGIVSELANEHYSLICSPFSTSSIGSHFRHVIDHYGCLFSGLGGGYIDYDQRARDPLVEQCTASALQQLDAAIDALRGLQPPAQSAPNHRLNVSLSTAKDGAREAPFESTLQRELVFLHGHTTHHFSLVAVLMRLIGLPVDANLGVAPSTLAYQEQSRCVQ